MLKATSRELELEQRIAKYKKELRTLKRKRKAKLAAYDARQEEMAELSHWVYTLREQTNATHHSLASNIGMVTSSLDRLIYTGYISKKNAVLVKKYRNKITE